MYELSVCRHSYTIHIQHYYIQQVLFYLQYVSGSTYCTLLSLSRVESIHFNTTTHHHAGTVPGTYFVFYSHVCRLPAAIPDDDRCLTATSKQENHHQHSANNTPTTVVRNKPQGTKEQNSIGRLLGERTLRRKKDRLNVHSY
jgi:hypothetical protein